MWFPASSSLPITPKSLWMVGVGETCLLFFFTPFPLFMPLSSKSHWTLKILEKLTVRTWPFLVFKFPHPLSK